MYPPLRVRHIHSALSHTTPCPAQPGLGELRTGKLSLRNNFGLTKTATGMPEGDFTVEMWARGPAVTPNGANAQPSATILSYATMKMSEGRYGWVGWVGS